MRPGHSAEIDEDSPLPQCCELLPDFRYHIYNCPAEIDWRSISPLNAARVQRDKVPENAASLATNHLRAWKLLAKFFRHKMVSIPELRNPWV
jgi:hypothetical protein